MVMSMISRSDSVRISTSRGRWSGLDEANCAEGVEFEFENVCTDLSYNAADEVHEDRDALKSRIFIWVCRNRGRDAEDVSNAFGISGGLAVDLVGELLDEGLLNYDE